MKTIEEFQGWCAGAYEELGDPCLTTGLIFARFLPTLAGYEGSEIVATFEADGHLVLCCAPDAAIRVAVSTEQPRMDGDKLVAFYMEKITPGLWTLFPSANLPGLVHAFVVLYDVPDPAPWESLIVLAGRFQI